MFSIFEIISEKDFKVHCQICKKLRVSQIFLNTFKYNIQSASKIAHKLFIYFLLKTWTKISLLNKHREIIVFVLIICMQVFHCINILIYVINTFLSKFTITFLSCTMFYSYLYSIWQIDFHILPHLLFRYILFSLYQF